MNLARGGPITLVESYRIVEELVDVCGQLALGAPHQGHRDGS
jgi:hypothetical protein